MNVSRLIIVLGLFGVLTLFADPQGIDELERKLGDASCQTEMNIVSGEIRVFWDRKLEGIEQSIEKNFEGERRDLFRVTSDAWRLYRSAQVTYEASESQGGTIMPLVENLAFIEITKQRIRSLIMTEGLESAQLQSLGLK